MKYIFVTGGVVSSLGKGLAASSLATLLELHARLGTTMVFVSHDLAVVSSIADRIAVLRHGRLLEVADTDQLLEHPGDEYTASLLALARR